MENNFTCFEKYNISIRCHNASTHSPGIERTIIYLLVMGGRFATALMVIIFNAVALCAMFQLGKNKRHQYLHVMSLCLTDILNGISLFGFNILRILDGTPLPSWLCIATLACLIIFNLNSHAQIAAICIMRLHVFRISVPFSSYQTTKRLRRVVLVSLATSFTLTVAMFITLAERSETINSCSVLTVTKGQGHLFSVINSNAGFVAEVIVICTIVMTAVLLYRNMKKWKSSESFERHSKRVISEKTSKGENYQTNRSLDMFTIDNSPKYSFTSKELKGITTLLIVAILYALCVTPNNLLNNFEYFGIFDQSFVRRWQAWLSYLSPIVNPFIYCFRNQAVKDVIFSWRCCGRK